jgi:hypothetical protein
VICWSDNQSEANGCHPEQNLYRGLFMHKWHIQMVTLSTDKEPLRFSIEAPDLVKAKQIVLQEFRKQSPGKKNLYL